MKNRLFKIPIWEHSQIGNLTVKKRPSYFLIEGKDEKEAKINLMKDPCFIKNYNNLSLDNKKLIIPFTIRNGKIDEIPECKLRNKNERGEYICGRGIHENPWDDILGEVGEFGYCCIMGYDIPDLPSKFECPMKKKEFIFQV